MKIVVNRFALVQKIFLPKCKTVRSTQHAAQNKNRDGSRAENFLSSDTHKINYSDKQEDARKYQKSYRSADGGYRHESRQECSDNAADCVERV